MLPRYRSKDDFINDKWLTEQLKLIPFHEREYVCEEYSRRYYDAGMNEPSGIKKTDVARRAANTYLRERIENGAITAPIATY